MNRSKTFSIVLLTVFLLGGVAFVISQCKPKKPPETETTKEKTPTAVNVPEFNPDSAYALIEKQVSFGPRIPGTASQTKCADWLSSKLSSYNAKVTVQDLKVELYSHQVVPCKNVIGSFNPDAQKRILLCAHWDTRPWSDRDSLNPKKSFDGADDGGSGVAVLLEIARHFSVAAPGVGVDILFLDVEDYGPPKFDTHVKDDENAYCLGTQEWAAKPQIPNYRAYYGILLDMVGAKGATFLQEGVSLQYAPSIVKTIWDTGNSLGYSNYFVNSRAPQIIDDHTFINRINGTPTVDIINMDLNAAGGFSKHWHTQQDNMDIIDKNTLKAVGQTLMQVIYSERVDA